MILSFMSAACFTATSYASLPYEAMNLTPKRKQGARGGGRNTACKHVWQKDSRVERKMVFQISQQRIDGRVREGAQEELYQRSQPKATEVGRERARANRQRARAHKGRVQWGFTRRGPAWPGL